MHNVGNRMKEDGERSRKIFKEIILKNIPNLLMKINNLYIDDVQQTPNMINNKEIHKQTNHSKNVEI